MATPPDDYEPSIMGQRVVAADNEALVAMWAFGLDITNVRPGEFERYLNERYDAMVAGMVGGGGAEPQPDSVGEDSAQQC